MSAHAPPNGGGRFRDAWFQKLTQRLGPPGVTGVPDALKPFGHPELPVATGPDEKGACGRRLGPEGGRLVHRITAAPPGGTRRPHR